MSRSRIRPAAMLAAGLLALAAFSPAAAQTAQTPGTADAPRVVAIKIGAGFMDPAQVPVLKGETVTLSATNVSDTETEIIVGLAADVAADSGDSLKEAEHIAAGATGAVTYTFTGDGPWAYGDQVGDHYKAGAHGDIVFVDTLPPAASAAPVASGAPVASTGPVASAAPLVPGTADAPRHVAVAVGAGDVEPSTLDVQLGEVITFDVTNVSDTEVELIVGLAADVAADKGDSLKEAEHIAPGATKSIDAYPFDSAGPWAYGDQIADHYAAGAHGDIVIVAALTPAASPAAPAASSAAASTAP